MSLKGELETFYLASLLQLFSSDQKTGVLQVTDGKNEANIFIKDGIVIYASSSRRQLRLGRLLKEKGLISEEDLQKCLQSAKEKGQKLGEALVEEEYISTENLREILQHQVKEILYWLFFWKTGRFHYRDVQLKAEGALVTEVNTTDIILEASRRIDDWSVIRKQITSDELIFKPSGKAKDKGKINLNEKEIHILSLVDGARAANEVANDSGNDEFAAYRILYSLLLCGLVEQTEEVRDQERSLDDYSDVISVFCDVLQTVHENLETQFRNRASAIFDESKAELTSQQESLFRGFDVGRSTNINVLTIWKALNGLKDVGQGRNTLVEGFRSFFLRILHKEGDTLGVQAILGTLKDAEHVLSYVKQYQKNSGEKSEVVRTIQKLLAEVAQTIEHQRQTPGKSGDILSLLTQE
jgi:hypothetical protein